MMKFIIILLQLFVFLSTSCLKATKTDTLIQVAENLYSQQKFDYAALEYERIIFNSDEEEVINQLLLKKSFCNKVNGDHYEALQSLGRINNQFSTESFRDTIMYEKAINYFLLSDYYNAESILRQLNNNEVNFSTYFYLILLNEQGKWKEAKNVFEEYIIHYNLPDSTINIYSFLNDFKLKKGGFAKGLSYVIPGLGQLYLKKPKEAFFSFTLTVLTGYFVVSSFVGAYYVAAIGTGLPYFLRFYFGGQKSIKKIINDKNENQKNKINEVLNKNIIDINKSIF